MTADHEPQIGSVVVDYTEIYYSENWKVKAQNGSNLVVLMNCFQVKRVFTKDSLYFS